MCSFLQIDLNVCSFLKARIIELPRISFSLMGASKMIYAQWA